MLYLRLSEPIRESSCWLGTYDIDERRPHEDEPDTSRAKTKLVLDEHQREERQLAPAERNPVAVAMSVGDAVPCVCVCVHVRVCVCARD